MSRQKCLNAHLNGVDNSDRQLFHRCRPLPTGASQFDKYLCNPVDISLLCFLAASLARCCCCYHLDESTTDCLSDVVYNSLRATLPVTCVRDLPSFEIRFDFESNFRFGIRFVVMIRFEIFESSAPSIVLCKETIGGG